MLVDENNAQNPGGISACFNTGLVISSRLRQLFKKSQAMLAGSEQTMAHGMSALG